MSEDEKMPVEEIGEREDAPLKISRRDFLVGAGAGVVVTGAAAAGIVAMRGPQIQEVIKEIEVPVIQEVVKEGAPVVGLPATGLPATLRAVSLNIDGAKHDVVVDVRDSLWDTLTHTLKLRDRVNLGCDRAQCGACAVVIDGRAVNGCTVLTARLGRGQQILTVDGINKGTRMEDLHPIARAFWLEGGYQCGICTRGFIMATYDLLSRNPEPSDVDIQEALAGNICRCGEYAKMYTAVHKAAEEMRAAA